MASEAAPAAPAPAADTISSSMSSSSSSSSSSSNTRGVCALQRFKELLQSQGEEVPQNELREFGWPIPLLTSCDPSPFCIPQELLSFRPQETNIYKIFFKDTPKEVRIRQVFFHTPLTAQEQQWLTEFRQYCKQEKWNIPLFLEPLLLRIIWLAYRKWGDNIISRSFELAKNMVEWRESFLPLSDKEEEIKSMLETGVMYWSGRDRAFRPLLIIRLSRLHKNASPEAFKRLTIFCFEWGLRYLMVPGRVETITTLFDVRGVPLHQFPLSALTDMTNTLTKQYPFRLNRMLIINDSFFVQTVWNIAKQFLTEVQQQKMLFMRSGFEEELLKEYTPWQLEKCYGGTRPEIKTFYPFPVAPGPYAIGSVQGEAEPYKNAHKAVDRLTSFGVIWEGNCRLPVQWSPAAAEVFKELSLPPPENLAAAAAAAGSSGACTPENKEENEATKTLSKEPSDAAAAAAAAPGDAAAEGTAADADAAATAANVEAKNAAAAAETPTKEAAEAAVEAAQVRQKSQGQDSAAAEATAAAAAAAADAETPQGGEDASVSARAADTNTEGREERVLEETNKLNAAAPAASGPSEQAAALERQKTGKSTKSLATVEKIRGSKCCSRCKVQ